MTEIVMENIEPVKNQSLEQKRNLEIRKTKKRYRAVTAIALNNNEDDIDYYYERYSCTPNCDERTGSFPFFILTSSIIQIAVFVSYYKDVENFQQLCKFKYSMVNSELIFAPRLRHEAWRYYTYQFLHAGFPHIFGNVLMQLFLGIPLEMVHGSLRVGAVYTMGVVMGSLLASIVDIHSMLLGCSGGDYCLIFAYIANIIINCDHMHVLGIVVRMLPVSLYIGFDIYETYQRYVEQHSFGSVSYAAHIGGGIAGLTFGACMLKNFRQQPWENVLWIIMMVIFVVFLLFEIFWNVFFPDYSLSDSAHRDAAVDDFWRMKDEFLEKLNEGD